MSDLTLFAVPKSFRDPHIATIQRNAIRSWLELKPRPEVILFGDEDGIAEVARDHGVKHIPNVKRNKFGTPLVSDVFSRAELETDVRMLCYVNADIILLQDFCDSVNLSLRTFPRFLLGGRPWDLMVEDLLRTEGDWRPNLKKRVSQEGELRDVQACDYFVFTRGLWPRLPDLALGRLCFDSALLYQARRFGAPLIDATAGALAIHQHHAYPAGLGPGATRHLHPEVIQNVEAAGGKFALATWMSATHKIVGGQIQRHWLGYLPHWIPIYLITQKIQRRFWFPILSLTKPVRLKLGFVSRAPGRSHES